MAVDWSWPIEWMDGTPAWLHKQPDPGHIVGPQLVESKDEPAGWNRAVLPAIGIDKPIVVEADGTLERAKYLPRAPHIRNVELPILRWEDGAAPIAGELTNGGDILRLLHPSGAWWNYQWPTLRPFRDKPTPKLIEITKAMVAKEEAKAAEEAAMEENPLWGAF